jgi:hypothetical protein
MAACARFASYGGPKAAITQQGSNVPILHEVSYFQNIFIGHWFLSSGHR